MQGEGDLVVEGQLTGAVALRGHLTVAEGGSVSGDGIEAQAVTVGGTLEGEVAAGGPIELLATARVKGNLRGASVTIAEGAHFSGRLESEFELPAELGGAAREARPKTASRR